jgi:hypothetical protein
MMVPNASPPPPSGIAINTTPIIGGTPTQFLYDNAGTVGETAGMTWDSVNQAITLTGAVKASSIHLTYNALQSTGVGSIWIDNSGNMNTYIGDRWLFGSIDLSMSWNFYAGNGMAVQSQNTVSGSSIISANAGLLINGDCYVFNGIANCTANCYFRSYNPGNGNGVFQSLISSTTARAFSHYERNGAFAWFAGLNAVDNDAYWVTQDVFWGGGGLGAKGFAFKCPKAGGVIIGAAALATNATDGFLYIPTCAGTPTAAPPTAQTGTVPMVYDTTNNKFYIYNGGWKGGTVPGVWS